MRLWRLGHMHHPYQHLLCCLSLDQLFFSCLSSCVCFKLWFIPFLASIPWCPSPPNFLLPPPLNWNINSVVLTMVIKVGYRILCKHHLTQKAQKSREPTSWKIPSGYIYSNFPNDELEYSKYVYLPSHIQQRANCPLRVKFVLQGKRKTARYYILIHSTKFKACSSWQVYHIANYESPHKVKSSRIYIVIKNMQEEILCLVI